MTKSAASLWKYVLSKRQLKGHHFRRERPILNYIVDFVCLDLKLIVEVDGISHHHDEAIQYDIARDTKLKSVGFEIMRFSALDILNNMEVVKEDLEIAVDRLTSSE